MDEPVARPSEPDEEEAIAIAAALEAVFASSGSGAVEPPGGRTPKWRFSGRWWRTPVASRRDRPR